MEVTEFLDFKFILRIFFYYNLIFILFESSTNK